MREKRWGALYADAVARLEAAGIPEADRLTRWILSDVLGCRPASLIAYPQRGATPEQVARIEEMIARRVAHEPVQYILGYAGFYGLRLQVSPAVLIPRPETEQVVEAALERLQRYPAPAVLDVGTGSGCIALAVKHERPDAEVYACDLQEDALDIARANATTHQLEITFLQADMLSPHFPAHIARSFDAIISNPPYITDAEAETLAPEVRDFEPHDALFAGRDPLLFYRALIRHAARVLTPGGWLVFETHAHHTDAVCEILHPMNFYEIQSQNDLAGLPRIVTARRRLE